MSDKYSAIPEELRLLPQWVVWGKDKVPYNANTDRYGSVTDPSDWNSFDRAMLAIARKNDYNGPGFVFTANDPYTFIDLDDTKGDQVALNRQIEIHKEFDSYSEISPSGRGLHIIVRGHVPAGRRQSFVEIYSDHRYATFTGNVYNDKPIRDCQEQLTRLWQQMGPPINQMGSGQVNGQIAHADAEETYSDDAIIKQATSAANGVKFTALYKGEWQGNYPSQSQADLALVNMLAFYTKNRNQIVRIFKASALGQRSKANRTDYLEWTINRAFDRDLPPIDFDGFKQQIEAKIATKSPVAQLAEPNIAGDAGSSPAGRTIPIPAGLLGELAQFIYNAAPLPVAEIALAGAIGFMAGICGRAYNVNGEGLNQYVLLVAASGTGKEAMASGVDKLVDSIKMQCPTSSRIVGPSEITSGEALIRYINKPNNQCFVSILSEFGYRLQALSDKRNFAQSTLKRMLLQLYHLGGKGRVFKPKIFSDKDKDIGETASPAFSILAESTPSTFYECLTEEIIADGFLPRFIIVEYKGERVPLNNNMVVTPSMALVSTLASFFAHCETLAHTQNVYSISETDEVKIELKKFEEYVRNMINKNAREDIRQLWNRAHIKAWKLAGLVAVGVNPYNPVIQLSELHWALNIVHNDIKKMSSKFETGEVGSSSVEIKQMKDIRRVVRDYFTLSSEKIAAYKIKQELFKDKKIPWAYLSRRLHTMSAFNRKEERIKGSDAIKHAVSIMIDRGELQECNSISMKEDFRAREIAFIVTDVKILDDEE